MSHRDRELVRLTGAKKIIPYGTTKFYGLIKEKKLPPPIKIGRASFWDRDALQEAVDRLIEDEVAA